MVRLKLSGVSRGIEDPSGSEKVRLMASAESAEDDICTFQLNAAFFSRTRCLLRQIKQVVAERRFK